VIDIETDEVAVGVKIGDEPLDDLRASVPGVFLSSM
jgi:hypothetical protein